MAQTTTPERFRRVKALFAEALELPGPERERHLEAAAGGDVSIAEEVRELLAAHGRDGGFVERIVADEARELLPAGNGAALAGRRIGAWELIRPIGSGGMGTVFLARRADAEYRAEAALKIVRPGLFSEEILRRFRARAAGRSPTLEPSRTSRACSTAARPTTGCPTSCMEYVEGRADRPLRRRATVSPLEARLRSVPRGLRPRCSTPTAISSSTATSSPGTSW